jgi:putative hydrolase of the HAD superfamily
MSERRAIVFDMDDTLYLERDYVRSGFSAVASTAPQPKATFQTLWEWFEAGVRGDTFNRILEADSEWAARTTVSDLISIYRSHTPDIELLPEAAALLSELRAAGVSIGVLTDGPKISQQLKVSALGLEAKTDHVLMTDTLGREHWKPSEKGFIWMEQRLEAHGSQLVYIGDNPKKDFIAPKARAWKTVRLRMDGQLRQRLESPNEMATAEMECIDWSELSSWIRRWVGIQAD